MPRRPAVVAESMPRLVIVDPAYASTVGHHGEVNAPLLAALQAAGWAVELWADVALEGEQGLPALVRQHLRGVFSGCGYTDPRSWNDLGGALQLARRLEGQLEQAQWSGEPVAAWLVHSLLPFQLLGLARRLSRVPAAQLLISLMFPPGETLEGPMAEPQAIANARVALAALARAVAQQGHQLTLAFPSRQQEQLYAPLLQATGLESTGVHPALVGAGCRPQAPPADAPPLVLLHWGDLKAGKGRQQALAVLEALLQPGAAEAWRGWGWLFHQHSREALPAAEQQLLQRAAAAELGLVWLQRDLDSQAMHDWLARCPLALLAYDPVVYGQRSSGMLWQWAAARQALALPAVAVGHRQGWLALEARAMGLPWQLAAADDGAAWLQALAAAAAGRLAGAEALHSYGQQLLSGGFGAWCAGRLDPAAAVVPTARGRSSMQAEIN